MMAELFVTVLAVVSVGMASGTIGSLIGQSKGYLPVFGFWISFFFGPFGWAWVALTDNSYCGQCCGRYVGNAVLCPHCRSLLNCSNCGRKLRGGDLDKCSHCRAILRPREAAPSPLSIEPSLRPDGED